MYYKLNEQGEIGLTCSANLDGYLYTEEEIVQSFDGQKLYFKHQTEVKEYKEQENAYKRQKHLEILRKQREKVCFDVINRGQIWYATLTDQQIMELNGWYKEWLDVTVTLVEPTAPSWLS